MQQPTRFWVDYFLFFHSLIASSFWPEIYGRAFISIACIKTSLSDSLIIYDAHLKFSPRNCRMLLRNMLSSWRIVLNANYRRNHLLHCLIKFQALEKGMSETNRLMMHCSHSSCLLHRAAKCLWGNDKKHKFFNVAWVISWRWQSCR